MNSSSIIGVTGQDGSYLSKFLLDKLEIKRKELTAQYKDKEIFIILKRKMCPRWLKTYLSDVCCQHNIYNKWCY